MTDFFIIGAARAGTTRLGRWLRKQPGIALPAMMEPHYFCYAGYTPRGIGRGVDPWFASKMTYNLRDYQAQFSSAKLGDIRGDASCGYLHFMRCARAIKEHNSKARILCLLRNPVERAFAQFLHYRRYGFEPLHEFADALSAESRRRAEGWWWGHYYRDVGSYAARLQKYYDAFAAEQILVLTQDSLDRDPAGCLERVMEHIGAGKPIPTTFTEQPDLETRTPTVPRYAQLHHLIGSGSKVEAAIKWAIPGERGDVVRICLKAFNSLPLPELAPGVREALSKFYQEDIERTERLTGLDLKHWYGQKGRAEAVQHSSTRQARGVQMHILPHRIHE